MKKIAAVVLAPPLAPIIFTSFLVSSLFCHP